MRRGEAEAKINLGTSARGALTGLFKAVGDTAFSQVVRGHLYSDLIAREYADTVFAHTASCMRNDLMIINEFHAKGRVREKLDDFAFKLQ